MCKRLRELEAENAKLQAAARRDATRQDRAGGRCAKKVVKPAQRRAVVGYLQQRYSMRQRRACRLVKFSRESAAYQAKPRNDQPLSDRLKTLGEQYPRYGYLMLHAMLKSEGLVVNRKRT